MLVLSATIQKEPAFASHVMQASFLVLMLKRVLAVKLDFGVALPPTVAQSAAMALSLLKMQQFALRAQLAFLLQQTRQNVSLAP